MRTTPRFAPSLLSDFFNPIVIRLDHIGKREGRAVSSVLLEKFLHDALELLIFQVGL
jgi:hypothetical protein